MKAKMKMLLACGALAVPLGALATVPVGTQTQRWMALQKAPAPAAKCPVRPMPGEVADRVYERYLKSFTQPIPEAFDRKKFVQQD